MKAFAALALAGAMLMLAACSSDPPSTPRTLDGLDAELFEREVWGIVLEDERELCPVLAQALFGAEAAEQTIGYAIGVLPREMREPISYRLRGFERWQRIHAATYAALQSELCPP